MKGIIKIMAIAMVGIFASCSNEMPIADDAVSKQPIRIRATTDGSTRAHLFEEYGNGKNPSEFIIYAWVTGETWEKGKYIDGEKVVYNSALREYVFENGPIYWPTNSNLTFLAYRGETGSTCVFNKDTNAPGLINYETPQCADSHYDFLYYVSESINSKSNNKTVNINFKHGLSQIIFKGKNTNSNTIVAFGEINICNCFLYGQLNFKNCQWQPSDGTRKVTGSYQNMIPISGIGEADYSNCPYENSDDYYMHSNVMYLMPQEKEAYNPQDAPAETFRNTNKAYIMLYDFCVRDKNSGKYIYNKHIYIPFEINWDAGKRYTYTLVFGGEGNGYDADGNPAGPAKIGIEVSTSNFTDVTDQIIDVKND